MAAKRTVDKAQVAPRARRRAKAEASPSQVTIYRVLDGGSPGDPQSEREFIMTESLPLPDGLDIERWLQRTAGPGRYRAEYRAADGRVIEVDKVLIGGIQRQGIVSDGYPDIELGDEDELSETDVDAILDRKLAEFRRELLSAIHHDNGSQQAQPQTSLSELVTALRSLDDLRAKPEPQTQNAPNLIGQLRELEEVRRMFTLKEPNPRPIEAERELTTERALLKLIGEDRVTLAALRDRIIGGDGEELDMASHLIQQLPQIMPHVTQMVTSIANTITAAFQRSSAPAQADPGGQPFQQAMPGDAQQPAQTMPANAPLQPAQATQPDQGQQFTPQDELLNTLIAALEQNAPIPDVCGVIYASEVRHPELGETIDGLVSLSTDQLLQMVTAIYPPVVQMPHARAWLKSLVEALTSEETSDRLPNEAGDTR